MNSGFRTRDMILVLLNLFVLGIQYSD